MLLGYQRQSLESLRRPKKDKKQKGSRIFARLGAKPKKSVTKSEKQRFLQQILRSTKNVSIPTMENINAVLTDEKVDASTAEKQVFLAAAKSQVDVKSLSIARNIISKSFSFFILSPTIVQDFLTNDYLYISFLASSVAEQFDIARYLKYKSASAATKNALILSSNQKFREYFYQDFSPECGSPNWFFTKTVTDYTVDSSRQKTFYIDNVKFVRDVIKPKGQVQGQEKTATVIYKEDFGLKKAIDKLNKIEKIYDKTELMKGVKILDKNSGAYYVQTSLKSTSFCPSILEFPTDIEISLKYLFSYEIDVDQVFNILISKFETSSSPFFDIIEIFTYITIDQFPNLIDFISVIYLIKKDETQKNLKDFIELIDLYNTYSYVVPGLGQLYKKFEKVVLQFIDSFDSGITIDKMIAIYNNSSEYLNAANIVNQSDTLTFIQKFKSLNLALPMINNFFDDHTTTMIMMVKKIANNVLNPRDVETDLVMEVRTVGTALFNFLFKEDKQCICKIRSPCVFLGNLYGEFNADILQKNLEKLKGKIAKTEDKLQMELEKERNIISKYADNTKNLLDELTKVAQNKDVSKQELLKYINKTKEVVDASLKTKQDYTSELADILTDKMDIDDYGDLHDYDTGETIIKSGRTQDKSKKATSKVKKQDSHSKSRSSSSVDKKPLVKEKEKVFQTFTGRIRSHSKQKNEPKDNIPEEDD